MPTFTNMEVIANKKRIVTCPFLIASPFNRDVDLADDPISALGGDESFIVPLLAIAIVVYAPKDSLSGNTIGIDSIMGILFVDR